MRDSAPSAKRPQPKENHEETQKTQADSDSTGQTPSENHAKHQSTACPAPFPVPKTPPAPHTPLPPDSRGAYINMQTVSPARLFVCTYICVRCHPGGTIAAARRRSGRPRARRVAGDQEDCSVNCLVNSVAMLIEGTKGNHKADRVSSMPSGAHLDMREACRFQDLLAISPGTRTSRHDRLRGSRPADRKGSREPHR